MTIKEATELVVTKFPGRIPIGYWTKGDVYVINTRPMKALRNMPIPAQFVVTQEGNVYGTNPMVYDLDAQDMIKL